MPFVKGKSGNPLGRPKKGETLTDLLEKKLSKNMFVEKVIGLIEKGDITTIKYVWDRLEGKIIEQQMIRQATGIPELDEMSEDELQEVREYIVQFLRSRKDAKTNRPQDTDTQGTGESA